MEELHVDSIRKSYKKIIPIDVFVSCKKDEITGFFGRNGSGKFTLLKIIFGVKKAESKFVKVGDRVINNVADAHDLINYVPQNNFLRNHINNKIIFTRAIKKRALEE